LKTKKHTQFLQKALSRSQARLKGAIVLEKYERSASIIQRLDEIRVDLQQQSLTHLSDIEKLKGNSILIQTK
jgi:hypothetical protein